MNSFSIWRHAECGMAFSRSARAAMAFLAVALLAGSAVVRADVVPRGDVLPATDDGFTVIYELPQFGGEVAGEIIVGGTDMQIGGTDLGTLTIDIPQDTDPLVSDTGIIADIADGSGLVSVVSLNSEWRINEILTIADEGQGFLEVLAGARVTSNFSERVNQDDVDMFVGMVRGSQGFVNVDGFGSLLKHQNISVGEEGHGRVEILDFARMETINQAFIGREKTTGAAVGGVGSVFVDGLGTRWNIGDEEDGTENDLTVGNKGRGILEIRNEAWVRVLDDGFIGVEDESYGEVTVADQGSLWWIVDDMFIGNPDKPAAQAQLYVIDQGTARADNAITVAAGGRVDLAGGVILTPDLINSGVIRGDGRIETSGSVVNELGADIRNAASTANLRERLLVTGPVTNEGLVESIDGEMEFESLFTNETSGQIFGRGAILRFRDGLTNDGMIDLHDTVVEATLDILNTGLLAVGQGPSFVEGSLELASGGVLDVILGEPHSQLHVTDTLTIDGTLSVGLDDDYMPEIGDSFEVLSAGVITGTFATESLPSISGFSFDVDYSMPASVFVNVSAGFVFTGDFNGDGLVNGADLAILLANYGLMGGATVAMGDANGDGNVNGDDFTIWQQQGSPALPVGGPVPEPSTAMLALAGLLALGGRRSRLS